MFIVLNKTFYKCSFEDACLALEVLWSSLPPPTQSLKSLADGGGVQLYEHRFWQPTRKNEDNNEMGSEENFDISSTTKLQTGCNLQGGIGTIFSPTQFPMKFSYL